MASTSTSNSPTRSPSQTVPHEASVEVAFTSFNHAAINVKDRKHLSIIDNPPNLSPGGNTSKDQGGAEGTYRLSDLLTPTSGRSAEESGGEGEEEREKGGSADEEGSEEGEQSESESSGSENEKDGDGDEESERVALKTRRTGKDSPNLDLDNESESQEGEKNESDESGYESGPKSSETQSEKETKEQDSVSGSHYSEHEDVSEELSDERSQSCGSIDESATDRKSSIKETSLAEGFSWLWQTSAFTDLTISCREYNFPLHKCILAAQCPTMIPRLRQVITTSGGPNGTILELHDNDPVALKAMLQYLYTGQLVVPTTNVVILGGPEVPSIDILVKVFELGCKYELPRMKKDTVEKYVSVLSTQWPKGHALFLAKCMAKVFEINREAERREECEQRFESGVEELKEATLEVAVKFSEDLMQDSVVFDLLDGEPLRALMMKMSRLFASKKIFSASSVGERRSVSAPVTSTNSRSSMEGFWR